ncbi:MAG: EAL domain-containing protein [Proteobacteria bacterium]|nr:EAL domain-containing protein [Pseudomonadota bacterium]
MKMTVESLDAYRTLHQSFEGSQIMVVEDNSTERNILQRLLENFGFTVTAVTSGEEALHRLNNGHYALMLLDVLMPNMDGLEVLKAARQKYSPSELPIIMVTIKEDSDDIVTALSLGANDYIVKPVDMPVLRARINTHLSHKESEDVLRESEDRFRSVFENAPIGMGLGDKEGNILQVNRAACEMVGYTKAELIGKNYLKFIHPDDREVSFQRLRKLFSGKTGQYRLEKRYRHKDGHYIWVDISVSLIRGANGNPSYLIEQAQDITERKVAAEVLAKHKQELEELVRERTKKLLIANDELTMEIAERKQAEEELQKRAMQLQEAQRIAHLGTWEVDIVTNEVFWSDEVYSIFGLNPDSYVPTSSSNIELVHPDDREYILKARRARLRQNDPPFNLKFRIVRPDGEVRHIHGQGKMIRDERGTPLQFIGTIMDITETSQLSEQLSYQASHDALTGLVNRREFEYRLQRILDTARKDKTKHALCYLDLDQFKVINDTCGHVAGDALLRQLGSLLQEQVRKRDTLARLGGDEFGVLMEHCTLKQARRIATKLCKTIEEFRFAWEDRIFTIGVSIGLVPITVTSMNTIEILKQADTACYAAKDAGRNRVHIYHEDDTELARRHGEMQWVAQINRSLEEDRFCLYMQPIVPVIPHNDHGQHFEILLRMRDEKDNIIPPGAFLAAAERYNLSTRIDRWVIDNAFSWLTDNPVYLENLSQCAINLSALSLGDEKFLKYLIQQFNRTNIPPEKICFEITETAAIANLSTAMVFIKALKALGCKFALDDFGSGLSSFAYLKTLPVDYLKIDGMFVKDIETDPIDLAMVKSINEIGHVMGMQTIAEFVENEAILKKLREIGVDYAQGFGIAKPQPIESMM